MADDFMDLSELDARSRNRKAQKTSEGEGSDKVQQDNVVVPEQQEDTEAPIEKLKEVAALPNQPKVPGGRPKATPQDMALTVKDVEILTLLAKGAKKSAIALKLGISRMQLYRMLDSDRVKRALHNTRNRLESLADLAVDIIHDELLEGNVEVAQSLLKGIGAMKTSVNAGKDGKKVERSIAEEIMDADGTKTRRLIKERENDDES